jgi:hypothetical protein
VPTLIVAADADMAPPSHYVEVFKLLDGGLRDGGWMGEGRPKGGSRAGHPARPDALQPRASPLFATVALSFSIKRTDRPFHYRYRGLRC